MTNAPRTWPELAIQQRGLLWSSQQVADSSLRSTEHSLSAHARCLASLHAPPPASSPGGRARRDCRGLGCGACWGKRERLGRSACTPCSTSDPASQLTAMTMTHDDDDDA
eukprot:568345-Rhodomonas_salina.1